MRRPLTNQLMDEWYVNNLGKSPSKEQIASWAQSGNTPTLKGGTNETMGLKDLLGGLQSLASQVGMEELPGMDRVTSSLGRRAAGMPDYKYSPHEQALMDMGIDVGGIKDTEMQNKLDAEIAQNKLETETAKSAYADNKYSREQDTIDWLESQEPFYKGGLNYAAELREGFRPDQYGNFRYQNMPADVQKVIWDAISDYEKDDGSNWVYEPKKKKQPSKKQPLTPSQKLGYATQPTPRNINELTYGLNETSATLIDLLNQLAKKHLTLDSDVGFDPYGYRR